MLFDDAGAGLAKIPQLHSQAIGFGRIGTGLQLRERLLHPIVLGREVLTGAQHLRREIAIEAEIAFGEHHQERAGPRALEDREGGSALIERQQRVDVLLVVIVRLPCECRANVIRAAELHGLRFQGVD